MSHISMSHIHIILILMYIFNVYLKSNSELGKSKFYTNLVVLFFIYFHLNTIKYNIDIINIIINMMMMECS